jgi:hypothetical protein
MQEETKGEIHLAEDSILIAIKGDRVKDLFSINSLQIKDSIIKRIIGLNREASNYEICLYEISNELSEAIYSAAIRDAIKVLEVQKEHCLGESSASALEVAILSLEELL